METLIHRNELQDERRLLVSGKESAPPKRLWKSILFALITGIGFGLLVSPRGGGLLSEAHASLIGGWIALPGYIFLAVIQMVVIPLIVSSIVLGIAANENLDFLKKMGILVATYFIMTTCIAVLVGATLTKTIQPGKYIDSKVVKKIAPGKRYHVIKKPSDSSAETEIKEIPIKIASLIPTHPERAISEKEMFQVVIYSIFLATALAAISNRKAKPLLDLLQVLQEMSMQIVRWAMLLTPLAVFGLLANISMTIGLEILTGVGAYIGTVLAGLFALYVFYLLIVFVIARENPFKFMKKIIDVQLLAFSTSSSAAVMPLTLTVAEKKLDVDQSTAHFIIPLGATINMDGTALYQMTAAIFLTQVFSIPLSLPELALLAATTIGASIGTPSTPGIGIIILSGILKNIGVPSEGIFLIIGVDRILDMARTVINVTGDLTACLVTDRITKRYIGNSGREFTY